MEQVDLVEDLNRRLARLTAPLWFTATAQGISPDEKEIPQQGTEILLEAVTWRDGQRLDHTAAYPIEDFERLGSEAIASAFVDASRQALPRGSATPG
jgi:hypothetical protein